MKSPSRIRIAFVNHTAQLGGGEIALLELIRNLDTLRFEPIVILFSDGPLAPLLREKVEVHILPLSPTLLKADKDRLATRSLLRGSSFFAGITFLYRLHRLLRSIAPSIVYTNSLKADILGGIAGRLSRLPVVWHVRDRIAPDYLPRKVVTLFRALAKVIPTFIVANSAATMSSLNLKVMSHQDTQPQASRVIHDGVDPTKYLSTLIPGHCRPLTIGLIGRISPWKGQDIFVEAIHLIHETFPFVQFQIVGAATFGEVEFEHQLHHLLQKYELSHVVELTGFESDIPGRLQSLDIVVHASTIPEPFGQVIIEGMAAGKAVIATDGGGVPEIMIDGVTGILVPMKDCRAMADAMARLLCDAHLRTRMGLAARQHIQKNFTIRKTAEAVEDLSEQLLQVS